jgi:DNA topoisomerase-1
MLPPIETGDRLVYSTITAQEKFSQHPPRYTEASLVKKLEELGIGRPSTYAPTISTIQKREYVVKEDRSGVIRSYVQITLEGDKVRKETRTENVGQEKGKLFPTDIGNLVNSFLVQHFENILDYNFTATVEEEFDEIAQGKLVWNKMISDFYYPFHKQIETTLTGTNKVSGEKLLGKDPLSGQNIFVKIGRYGAMVQLGDTESENKPRFASLKKGQSIDTLTLEEALDLFKLPRPLGDYESSEVIVSTGRFGPYIRHNNVFFSLAKTDDPLTITMDRAIEVISEKRQKESERIISEFPEQQDLKILNGRYGPYLSYQKKNFKIPKGKDPRELTLEDCLKIVTETEPSKGSSNRRKK